MKKMGDPGEFPIAMVPWAAQVPKRDNQRMVERLCVVRSPAVAEMGVGLETSHIYVCNVYIYNYVFLYIIIYK